MRWVAKNVVAAGLADGVRSRSAYAIGKAQPVGLFVRTFGTVPFRVCDSGRGDRGVRPSAAAISLRLDLLRPIYSQTAVYGHFGRNEPDFTGSAPAASTPCASRRQLAKSAQRLATRTTRDTRGLRAMRVVARASPSTIAYT